MKVLILGAGALGGYYGARLLQAGVDVTFLVRQERQEKLRSQGIVLRSAAGDFQAKVNMASAEDVDPLYDVVLLTCKAYDLDSAIASIAPAVADTSIILPLLNGVSAYDTLDRRFGRRRVLGGIAYIATKLLPNGEIIHFSPFDKLVIGARDPIHADAATKIHEVFSSAPGDRVLSDRISVQLWEKWVMICAGAAATCLMRSAIGRIMHTSSGEHLIRALLNECRWVARESGFDLDRNAVGEIEAMLLDKNSKWAASMMRDIEAGAARIESDAIVGDMIQRARKYSIETPYLDIAYSNLQAYTLQLASS